jgi:hypothetical protein
MFRLIALLLAVCFAVSANAAPNPSIDPGTSPSVSIATEEISSIQYQKMKIIDGTTSSTAAIGVSANPWYVQGTVTCNAGTNLNTSTLATQATLASALTALELIDDTVETEDAAHASGDKGVMSLAVRTDTPASLAGTTGDYAPLQLDSSGNLRVNVAAGGGTGGTAAADETTFTAASTQGTAIQGAFDDTGSDTVAEDKLGIARITTNRALHVNLRDATGAELSVGGGTQYNEDTAHTTADKVTVAGVVRKDTAAQVAGTDGDYSTLINDSSGRLHVNVGAISDGSGSLTVDGTVAATQSGAWNVTNISGTVSLPTGAATETSLSSLLTSSQLIDDAVFAEDVASANADKGVQVMAVRKASPANVSGTDGDYEPLQVSAGRLWTSATIDAALPAGTNAIGKLAANSGIDIGDVDVTSIAAGDNNIGNVDIVTLPALAAGTNGIGKLTANSGVDIGDVTIDNATLAVTQSGTWTVQPGNTANTTAWLVSPRPATSGGLDIFRSLDLDETEEEIKASAGQIGWYYLFNAASSTRFFKFYNATAASVTVGSTTPVLTIAVPAGSGANAPTEHMLAFGTAITAACTTGVADADTGAPAANECILNVGYK